MVAQQTAAKHTHGCLFSLPGYTGVIPLEKFVLLQPSWCPWLPCRKQSGAVLLVGAVACRSRKGEAVLLNGSHRHLPLCLSCCPTAERELPRADGIGWAAVGAVYLPWPGWQDDPQGHGTLSRRVLPEQGRYRGLPASLPLRTAK